MYCRKGLRASVGNPRGGALPRPGIERSLNQSGSNIGDQKTFIRFLFDFFENMLYSTYIKNYT